jgi:hypothetical protein
MEELYKVERNFIYYTGYKRPPKPEEFLQKVEKIG